MKALSLLVSILLLNISFNSINTCTAQDSNHSFLIDSTKNTACNICLIEDLIDKLKYELIVLEVQGENYEVEKTALDSLNSRKERIIEVYEKETGYNTEMLYFMGYASNDCLKNYSFIKIKESERIETLLSFEAYYRNLDIPTPQDTIMDLEDFEKEENGNYKYYVRGQKFNLSLKELELQIESVNKSLVELNEYRNSKTDYFCRQYSGKNFSKMDKTEQLMFIYHLQQALFVTYSLEISERDKRIEDIRNEDIKLQKLKNEYLESTKVSRK